MGASKLCHLHGNYWLMVETICRHVILCKTIGACPWKMGGWETAVSFQKTYLQVKNIFLTCWFLGWFLLGRVAYKEIRRVNCQNPDNLQYAAINHLYAGWFPMTLTRHYQRLQAVLLIIIHWWKFGNSREKKKHPSRLCWLRRLSSEEGIQSNDIDWFPFRDHILRVQYLGASPACLANIWSNLHMRSPPSKHFKNGNTYERNSDN